MNIISNHILSFISKDLEMIFRKKRKANISRVRNYSETSADICVNFYSKYHTLSISNIYY